MTDIVFAHGGTVAKIVGDAMHVLFGAPADQPDHAARAVACALELDDFAQAFRERWRRKGVVLGATRLGLTPVRRSSAISAAGGISTTPPMATRSTPRPGSKPPTSSSAPASASARASRAGSPASGPAGRRPAAARPTEPLRAFEPLSAEAFEDPATRAYLDAFAKLEAGDPAAMPAFAALLGLRSDDYLVGFHLKRLLSGVSGPRIVLD